MKKKDGILATKIYRKETHTNRYFNYESCHSQQQKQGIIISLLNRAAKLITDSKDFKEEKEMLRCVLEDNNNNYPNWLIKITFYGFKFSKIELLLDLVEFELENFALVELKNSFSDSTFVV